MEIKVYITIRPSVLDPAGTAVSKQLNSMGFKSVENVRIGKMIQVYITDGLSDEEISSQINDMCKKLLSNTIIEDYQFDIMKPLVSDDSFSKIFYDFFTRIMIKLKTIRIGTTVQI